MENLSPFVKGLIAVIICLAASLAAFYFLTDWDAVKPILLQQAEQERQEEQRLRQERIERLTNKLGR